jgi:hypothetical protein
MNFHMAQVGSFSTILGCGILCHTFLDGRELHIVYVLHNVTPPVFTIRTHQSPLKTTCTFNITIIHIHQLMHSLVYVDNYHWMGVFLYHLVTQVETTKSVCTFTALWSYPTTVGSSSSNKINLPTTVPAMVMSTNLELENLLIWRWLKKWNKFASKRCCNWHTAKPSTCLSSYIMGIVTWHHIKTYFLITCSSHTVTSYLGIWLRGQQATPKCQ